MYNLLCVLYRIKENQLMDLRLSLAEVTEITEDLTIKEIKEKLETIQLTSAGRLC